MNWRCLYSFSLGLVLAFSPGAVLAESRKILPPLGSGLSVNEVIKRWGEPGEKQEFEIRRKEVWKYPGGEVTFLEGKVSHWKVATTSNDYYDVAQINQPPAQPKKDNEVPVREILNEIMKEPPSDDKDPPQAPNPVMPGAANAIPNREVEGVP